MQLQPRTLLSQDLACESIESLLQVIDLVARYFRAFFIRMPEQSGAEERITNEPSALFEVALLKFAFR